MCRALKHLLFVSLLLVSQQLLAERVSAQLAEPQVKIKTELDLKGLKQEQVAEKLGKPDQVNTKSKSQFQWIYGQSIVFFQDDAVIAWSDNGDLSSRANLATIRDRSSADYADFIRKWKNPWTPIKTAKPSEVIDLMLQGPE